MTVSILKCKHIRHPLTFRPIYMLSIIGKQFERPITVGLGKVLEKRKKTFRPKIQI